MAGSNGVHEGGNCNNPVRWATESGCVPNFRHRGPRGYSRAIPMLRIGPNNATRLTQNRLALVGEESVSVGHRRQRGAGANQESTHGIYIIGNDEITLCREAPATVNDGEI